METETFNKTAEHIKETLKSTANLYTKGTFSVMEAYHKQLETASDWWKKCVELTVNSGFPKKGSEIFPELIRKNAETYQKTFSETINMSKDAAEKILNAWSNNDSVSKISEEVSDAVMNIFRKQGELITETGDQLLNALQEYNLDDYHKEFDLLLKTGVKSSEKSIEYLIQEYNLKSDFTKNAGEQLTANIVRQFDLLSETNTRFFNELLKNLVHEKKEKNNNQ